MISSSRNMIRKDTLCRRITRIKAYRKCSIIGDKMGKMRIAWAATCKGWDLLHRSKKVNRCPLWYRFKALIKQRSKNQSHNNPSSHCLGRQTTTLTKAAVIHSSNFFMKTAKKRFHYFASKSQKLKAGKHSCWTLMKLSCIPLSNLQLGENLLLT